MRTRTITWMRKERRAELPAPVSYVGSKPTYHLDFDHMGIVRVEGPPLYDNGVFFVIDTVQDLEYAVCRFHGAVNTVYRRVRLDKYEAIRVADELKESVDRADA